MERFDAGPIFARGERERGGRRGSLVLVLILLLIVRFCVLFVYTAAWLGQNVGEVCSTCSLSLALALSSPHCDGCETPPRNSTRSFSQSQVMRCSHRWSSSLNSNAAGAQVASAQWWSLCVAERASLRDGYNRQSENVPVGFSSMGERIYITTKSKVWIYVYDICTTHHRYHSSSSSSSLI
jgi:hypothetical protein